MPLTSPVFKTAAVPLKRPPTSPVFNSLCSPVRSEFTTPVRYLFTTKLSPELRLSEIISPEKQISSTTKQINTSPIIVSKRKTQQKYKRRLDLPECYTHKELTNEEKKNVIPVAKKSLNRNTIVKSETAVSFNTPSAKEVRNGSQITAVLSSSGREKKATEYYKFCISGTNFSQTSTISDSDEVIDSSPFREIDKNIEVEAVIIDDNSLSPVSNCKKSFPDVISAPDQLVKKIKSPFDDCFSSENNNKISINKSNQQLEESSDINIQTANCVTETNPLEIWKSTRKRRPASNLNSLNVTVICNNSTIKQTNRSPVHCSYPKLVASPTFKSDAIVKNTQKYQHAYPVIKKSEKGSNDENIRKSRAMPQTSPVLKPTATPLKRSPTSPILNSLCSPVQSQLERPVKYLFATKLSSEPHLDQIVPFKEQTKSATKEMNLTKCLITDSKSKSQSQQQFKQRFDQPETNADAKLTTEVKKNDIAVAKILSNSDIIVKSKSDMSLNTTSAKDGRNGVPTTSVISNNDKAGNFNDINVTVVRNKSPNRETNRSPVFNCGYRKLIASPIIKSNSTVTNPVTTDSEKGVNDKYTRTSIEMPLKSPVFKTKAVPLKRAPTSPIINSLCSPVRPRSKTQSQQKFIRRLDLLETNTVEELTNEVKKNEIVVAETSSNCNVIVKNKPEIKSSAKEERNDVEVASVISRNESKLKYFKTQKNISSEMKIEVKKVKSSDFISSDVTDPVTRLCEGIKPPIDLFSNKIKVMPEFRSLSTGKTKATEHSKFCISDTNFSQTSTVSDSDKVIKSNPVHEVDTNIKPEDVTIDDDSLTPVLNCKRSFPDRAPNQRIVKKIKSSFENCFSSENNSEISINDSSQRSEKSNDKKMPTPIDITESNSPAVSQISDVKILLEVSSSSKNTSSECSKTSMVIKNAVEENMPKRRRRYKKDGLAGRLQTLIKKQRNQLFLWRHEMYLASNSNFVLPNSNPFCLFGITQICVEYGCYLIEAIDVNTQKECTILLNTNYECNVTVSEKSFLKVFEPFEIMETNIGTVIVNASKFECLNVKDEDK